MCPVKHFFVKIGKFVYFYEFESDSLIAVTIICIALVNWWMEVFFRWTIRKIFDIATFSKEVHSIMLLESYSLESKLNVDCCMHNL